MQLGIRIRRVLKEKHITQRELAAALYLTPSTINGYIQARRLPDCETLARIAIYLDTSTDYLLGITGQDEPPNVFIPPPAQ